jgi:hypothetical protein
LYSVMQYDFKNIINGINNLVNLKVDED